jgi:predicted dehydrogenase/NADPH:quinone reductase-like Zn-dependent oxidoreductase
MSPISRELRRQLEGGASSLLDALGYSGTAASEAKRDTWWWLLARARAVRARRGLIRGWAVAWTSLGYAELVPIDVLSPGPGEVTIQVEASAVSPGTERAHYLRLANTARVWIPGYSAAGTVVAVGPDVASLRVGDRVAASGVQHASVATVPAGNVYPIPAGVTLEAAALVQLGVICGQGVEKCGPASGEAFGVVGSGVIGALAQRLAAARGGDPAAIVARSRSKERIARRGGAARFLVVGEDDGEIAALRLPVVIEATGSPEAINVAIAAAGSDGRIVLLGSPRGTTRGLAVDQIREKGLRLIGAHVRTLDSDGGVEGHRRHAAQFLEAVAAGMPVDDLTGPGLDPREAGAFYRDLVHDSGIVGAHFDWSHLEPHARISNGGFLRLPNLLGRGVDADGPPLRDRSYRVGGPLAIADPFADAEGHLRIGMVGCGDIAVSNAAAAVAAPNVSVTACYDPERGLAADIAERCGGIVCSTCAALLERADVDAVLLSVPHHLHAPLAIEAARAGKHVIVEKPPANELAGASAMIAAAREARVVLSVCFPDRYEPRALLARRLIEGGALGEFAGATVKFFRDKTATYWLGGFSGRSRSDWRRLRDQAGGGVLIMNLSHYLDLLLHLTGVEVDELGAVAASTDPTTEVEDVVSVSMRFGNGAVATVSGGSAVRGAEASEFRLWGRDGHIALEPDARFFTLRALDDLRTARWHTLGKPPRFSTRAVYLSRLATAIARGTEPDVTGDDALAVQAVIEAAYEASRTATVVRPSDVLARATT